MKTGELVVWQQGHCETPGIILETRAASSMRLSDASYSSHGMGVLAMLPELGNDPEWFHECELISVRDYLGTR